MKPQTPAEGILKTHDWGDSRMYKVTCQCGNDDDAIEFEIEADESGVSMTTYLTQKTNWWTETIEKRYDINNPWLQEFDWFWKDIVNGFVTRVKHTWTIWRYGYIKYQSTTIMSEQQALNYAETINLAVRDVKFFQEERKWKTDLQNRIAKKLAEETDCI